MNGQHTVGISFGPFFLDTAGRRLLREGRRVSVTPIELKLLETLLRNRERVLSGDELRILVWSDNPSAGIVPAQDVNALYVAVRRLRKSLGKYGKWIINIPKVGYTVAAEVEIETAEEKGISTSDSGHPFVGRQAEIVKLKTLLAENRLVTLTGPPGIGKSRLAAKLASESAFSFPDGFCPINLVPIENEDLVAAAVLNSLGLIERIDRSDIEIITDYVKDKRALLLFDNCEHVVNACSNIVDNILRTAPGIRVIATSSEPLMIPGESVKTVPPLSVPGPNVIEGSNGPGSNDAVELFMTLAKQYRPDFEIDGKDTGNVAELCRRLEGIPLAIELAAVQVDAYTVEQIIEAMSDRFRLLRRRGGEDLRHQTLERAFNWSYSLLSEEERIFLRRLSVFAGGWTSETAREICAGDGVEGNDTVHLLAQLVRRSLIQFDGETGRQRYGMLETIRQFGRGCLREAGEEDRVFGSHDKYFAELAEKAFDMGEKGDWPERLAAEYDNARSVLERSIRAGRDIETGLRMCGALGRYWFNYGRIREARSWIKLALDADDGSYPTARAKALRTGGFFFGQMSTSAEDSEQAEAYFEESLTIWRELGDESQEALTLSLYAMLLNRLGRFDEARHAVLKSLDIFTEAVDHTNIARSVNMMALTLLDIGEAGEAKPAFEIALSAARIAEDRFLEALCLQYLGDAAVQTGELVLAEEYLSDSLERFRSLGHRPLVARILLLQGEVATLKNQSSEALALERTALEEFREIEDNQGVASALEAIACTVAKTDNHPADFLILNSAADALRQKINLQLGPARKRQIDRFVQSARAAIDQTTVLSAVEKGKNMSLNESVEFALAVSA